MNVGLLKYVDDSGRPLTIENVDDLEWTVAVTKGLFALWKRERKVALILAAATVLCACLYTDLTVADTLAELIHGLDCMGEHL